MKGPSTHKGTKRHTEELKFNRNMDQTNLSDGRPGSSAVQLKDSSPAKGIEGSSIIKGAFGKKEGPSLGVDNPFDKPRVKSKAEISFDVKQKLKKKPQTKAQEKKLAKDIKSDKKFIKKADKRSKKGKTTKPDKPGNVVSRAADKVGKKIKQGVKQKVADFKRRQLSV